MVSMDRNQHHNGYFHLQGKQPYEARRTPIAFPLFRTTVT